MGLLRSCGAPTKVSIQEADHSASVLERVLVEKRRVFGALAIRRLTRTVPFRSRLPVICVGNFTAGGTGKTPMSLALVRLLPDLGETPAVLTRGYGGRISGPHWVDPESDGAGTVGDEPLLIAGAAPVMLARDRTAGARAIEQGRGNTGASVIVMDDGLQNPGLAKDLSIALVDGKRGVGNGEVIPAGPLRAPLDFQLGLVHAIVVNRGFDGAAIEGAAERTFKRLFTGPVLAAEGAVADEKAWLEGARVIAYAGIANPGRFFDLIARCGAGVIEQRAYPDHHTWTEGDAALLLSAAETAGASLVTTEKDYVRLARDAGGALGRLRAVSRTLPIALRFDDLNRERLRALVVTALKEARARRG